MRKAVKPAYPAVCKREEFIQGTEKMFVNPKIQLRGWRVSGMNWAKIKHECHKYIKLVHVKKIAPMTVFFFMGCIMKTVA